MSERKKLIPDNPFDAHTGSPEPAKAKKAKAETAHQDAGAKESSAPKLHAVDGGKSSDQRKPGRKAQPGKGAIERLGFPVPQELAQEVKGCVVQLSGFPYRMTIAKLAEMAFTDVLKKLAKEANDGKPFPKLDEKLPGGRPIGS